MAREETDREDLLREATALIERIELRVPHEVETVVAGFRRNGAASFFFGADPVYQFNTSGELRRAYVAGRLLKAEQGRLVQLTRERTADAVHLVRHELDATETADVLQRMSDRLAALRNALDGPYEIVGQVPNDADVLTRVLRELTSLCVAPRIANSPRVE